jgi:hypothetical protein
MMRTASALLTGLVLTLGCGDSDGGSGAGGQGGEATAMGGNTTTATGGNGSGGAGVDICTPVMGDTACVACVREGCCAELHDCEGDAECTCLLDCFIAGNDPVGCVNQCGNSTAVNGLVGCASTGCATECVTM